jgi:hypothetical protein
MSWNTECLKTCINESDFLDFLANFDLFFSCERWQTRRDEYTIDGYTCVDIPRIANHSIKNPSKRCHGGTCLFVKDGIDGVEISRNGL